MTLSASQARDEILRIAEEQLSPKIVLKEIVVRMSGDEANELLVHLMDNLDNF